MIAVLIDDIVTLENLGGQLNVTENERAETLADHGAYGGGHRSQLFWYLCALHFAEGDDALGETHGEVTDALEAIGDFQGGDDKPHLIVRERPSAEQADGVFVDHDFHFVDARFEEKHFAGESRRAGTFQANNGIQSAVHGAFYGASHGNEIVHERIVEHGFRETSSGCHGSPFGVEGRTSHSHSYTKLCLANGYSLLTRM